MSSEVDQQWYARAGALLPHMTAGEGEQLNEYVALHDGETFAMFVTAMERKYLSADEIEAAEGVTDEELDTILSERIKRATKALNGSEGVF